MPETGNGGSEGGRDYGWLYGGSQGRTEPGTDPGAGPGPGSAGQRADSPAGEDPEPTRVMPVLRRDADGAAARGQDAPLPRRTVPTRQPVPPPRSPRSSSARSRRRIGPGRIVLLLLVAWIAYLVAVPVWAASHIAKVDITPTGARPAEQPGTTYLIVGSDSRKGLSAAENRKLGTGGVGAIGSRTDTIMLLHTGSGPNLLLSIPRDSLVPIPGHGTTKINAAFAYGGPKLLVQTIEQDTGVRIDHYVEIGFGGFVNSVDAVGGVTICPTQRMVDPRANLRIRKGCQQVNGVTALGYARSRHVSRYGDLDRARHQREVVSAIGSKVKSPWTILNPVRYFRVNEAATSSLTVSTGTGPIALAKFALAMTRVSGGGSGLTCGMPIADEAVHWDRSRALELLSLIKQDKTADIPKRLCTPTGLAGVN